MRQLNLQASALLSLLVAASSLSTESYRNRRSLSRCHAKPSSDSKDVFGLATLTASTSQTKSRTRQQRKKQVKRSPLVDSDLLRFLGMQKKLKRNLTSNSTAAAADSFKTSSSSSSSSSRTSSLGTATTKDIGTSLSNRTSNLTRTPVPEPLATVVEGKNTTPGNPFDAWLYQLFPFLGTQQKKSKQYETSSINLTNTTEETFTASAVPVVPAEELLPDMGVQKKPKQNESTSSFSPATNEETFEVVVPDAALETDTSSLSQTSDDSTAVAAEPVLATVLEEDVVEEDSAATFGGNVMDSWLGQYNSHRVAAVLMSKDDKLDESLALKAGERVQSQVLSRFARRRVRAFLKERDREWGVKRVTSPKETSVLYGIEDVVNLLLGFGLTARDIAEILVHTPGVALMRPHAVEDSRGESLEKTMDRALTGVLCGKLKLRKYDARKVIRNCPGLLTMRGSRSAEQVVDALSRLGISTNSIARDKNALPTLLSRAPSGIFRLVAFLSSDAVRMAVSKIGPLLRRPICEELLDAVVPVPRFDQGTDEVTVGAVSDGTNPGVLTALWGCTSQQRRDRINDTYRKMSTTAWTLRHQIGTVDLGKVVAAYPSVLLLDAEHQILPAANYLMNLLGIWEDDLPRVLQQYPTLLGVEIAQMERVASYLISLNIAQENLSTIFRSFPALLTLDIEEQIVPVVEFLRSIGIANVGRFISRLPPILGYSVNRELKPKWEYVDSVFTDARFELTKFPAYFSYPLERVIKTRFEYLREVKRIPIPLLALDQVLRYGDKDFAIKVAKDGDNGSAFSAFAEQRKSGIATQGPKKPRQKRNNSRL